MDVALGRRRSAAPQWAGFEDRTVSGTGARRRGRGHRTLGLFTLAQRASGSGQALALLRGRVARGRWTARLCIDDSFGVPRCHTRRVNVRRPRRLAVRAVKLTTPPGEHMSARLTVTGPRRARYMSRCRWSRNR